MDRLIASNSVPLAQADTAPATGTPQYATDGNPATNTPATLWPAYAFNTIQDEIYNVIVAAGLAPDRTKWNQLLTAIQTMLQGTTTNVGVDTGAANAYVVAFTPALTAPIPWAPFWVKVKTANTGASTLNATGTAKPLVGGAHQALQGGELVANGNALIYWNPTLAAGNGSYVLLFCSGAPQQIAPATQSEHAVQLAQLAAGTVNLGNRAQFTSSTTFTIPANVTTIWRSGCAPGGGGGGSGGISGASAYSATSGGGGGMSGQWERRVPMTVVPGSVLTLTIGAPGSGGSAGAVGGAGGNGGAAGNNTITGTGVNVTLTGGLGGRGSSGVSGSGIVGTVGQAGGPGADDGFYGIAVSGYGYDTGGWGGRGGATPYGQSGGATASGLLARAGTGYGAGGSGASGLVTQSSSSGAAGAAGLPGYWEFEW